MRVPARGPDGRGKPAPVFFLLHQQQVWIGGGGTGLSRCLNGVGRDFGSSPFQILATFGFGRAGNNRLAGRPNMGAPENPDGGAKR